MNCKTVLAKASAYIDGELAGFEMLEMRSHLHSCRSCQGELDQIRYLKAVLGDIPDEEPGEEFANRLKERVFASQTSTQTHKVPVAMVSSLAFVAALAVSLVALRSHGVPPKAPATAKISDTTSFDVSRDQAYQAGGDAFNDASFIITASAPANGSR